MASRMLKSPVLVSQMAAGQTQHHQSSLKVNKQVLHATHSEPQQATSKFELFHVGDSLLWIMLLPLCLNVLLPW